MKFVWTARIATPNKTDSSATLETKPSTVKAAEKRFIYTRTLTLSWGSSFRNQIYVRAKKQCNGGLGQLMHFNPNISFKEDIPYERLISYRVNALKLAEV